VHFYCPSYSCSIATFSFINSDDLPPPKKNRLARVYSSYLSGLEKSFHTTRSLIKYIQKNIEPFLESCNSSETFLPKLTFFFTFLLHSILNQKCLSGPEKAEPTQQTKFQMLIFQIPYIKLSLQ
jgi:hypothetical protein